MQGFEWIAAFLLLFVGLPVWLIARSVTKKRKTERERSALDVDQVCDQVFNGSPTVTYRIGPDTLTFEGVIAGASKRGYQLAGQSADGVLAFNRGTVSAT